MKAPFFHYSRQSRSTTTAALGGLRCPTAAGMRYYRGIIRDISFGARREHLLAKAKDMFERMIAQRKPPAQVGPETHAELIKCCAAAGDFYLGYHVVRGRAFRMMRKRPKEFVLTDFFEAVLELCGRPAEALESKF